MRPKYITHTHDAIAEKAIALFPHEASSPAPTCQGSSNAVTYSRLMPASSRKPIFQKNETLLMYCSGVAITHIMPVTTLMPRPSTAHGSIRCRDEKEAAFIIPS